MPTYPIGQNATTARDGEVNVANVVKGHVNGSNVSDEAIIVPSGAVDLPTTADATRSPDAGPQPWVQPTGAHDAYGVGDQVTHQGKTWTSTVAANVWEPGTGSLWVEG